MKKLCIYHHNCADGFGAAYAVYKRFGDDVEFHPGVYQDPPPDVTGRAVILVDFSYKQPVLAEMAKHANSILVLDHHKSAEEDLHQWKREAQEEPQDFSEWNPELKHHQLGDAPVCAIFDTERSGAMIAWQFFHPKLSPPRLFEHIQDRDLWRFKLAGTREIQAVVFSWPYDFAVWDTLVARCDHALGCGEMIGEGKAIERKHFKDIDELLGVCTRFMEIAGYTVPVANLPYTLTSDAGHKLAQGQVFAACYWDTPEGRVFSLRSAADGLDVSEIAKLYGGGGHRNAAGFRLPHGVDPATPPANDNLRLG
jgi:oligoribonuclease NrnB/cAMP/cGMP phosphodiesterase (DHH superfamily)